MNSSHKLKDDKPTTIELDGLANSTHQGMMMGINVKGIILS
jgi:hypothetical protein